MRDLRNQLVRALGAYFLFGVYQHYKVTVLQILEKLNSGFRREVDENCGIWVFMQRVVVIYYRRIGTTYRTHPQGSRIKKRLDPIGFLKLR
jgi:hypothetical protein